MRYFFRGLLALCATLALPVLSLRAQAPAEGDLPLPESSFSGLKDLIAGLSRASPKMILRAGENAVAEGNRMIARSGQLPTVAGSFSYYPWDVQTRADQSGTLTERRMTYYVSLNQPVYHWGALQNNTRIGELGQRIARGQTAEVYRLLIEEVRSKYLQLIVYKAGVERTRFAQKLADEQLQLAKAQLEKHAMAPADMLGPTLAADRAALATEQAVADFADARASLARLTGGAPLTEEQVPDEVPQVRPISKVLRDFLDRFAGKGDPTTYALQNLRDQIEQERLNYAIANKRLWPKLSATIGASQDQQSYTLNTAARYQVRDYYFGVLINWSIFDGFATRATKSISLARRRELEQSYKDQVADTLQSVRIQLRQIEFAGRNLAMVEKLFGISGTALQVQKDNLARGLASQSDVNGSQLAFYDSRGGTFNARIDYTMKVCDFLSTILADPALANLPSEIR